MIDSDFKDELGSFEQAHLGFDMGDGKEFKGFAICNNRLHVLFTLKTDLPHHPLNCELAENYFFIDSEFSKSFKNFACKDVIQYIQERRKKNGK